MSLIARRWAVGTMRRVRVRMAVLPSVAGLPGAALAHPDGSPVTPGGGEDR